VARPANGIRLEQIVRADARAHEAAEERLQRPGVVVDSGEEDRLVHHREPCVGEARAREDGLLRELLRVIEMRHHPERVVRAERPGKLARHAHRKRHRNARRKADRVHVRDRSDRRDEPREAIGRHRERIPAAHDDVAYLGVVANVRERRGERVERNGASSVADHP
jgi:hypothetical protein